MRGQLVEDVEGTPAQITRLIRDRQDAGQLVSMTAPVLVGRDRYRVTITRTNALTDRPAASSSPRTRTSTRTSARSRLAGDPLVIVAAGTGVAAAAGGTAWLVWSVVEYVRHNAEVVVGWAFLVLVALAVAWRWLGAGGKSASSACQWVLVHLCGGGR